MPRFLAKIPIVLLTLVWLVYVSPVGFYLCLGLMTQDLPSFLAPILQMQFFMAVASLGGIPVVAFVLWSQKRTPLNALLGIISSLVVPSFVFWHPDYWPLRKTGLTRSTLHLNRLNLQLSASRLQSGQYPTSLAQIAGPLQTGMVCYSKVHYKKTPATSPSGGYELMVPTIVGLGFDSFFFWPSQNYPKRIYGGEVELISTPGGVWAYVHE